MQTDIETQAAICQCTEDDLELFTNIQPIHETSPVVYMILIILIFVIATIGFAYGYQHGI